VVFVGFKGWVGVGVFVLAGAVGFCGFLCSFCFFF
jgi:hypothetical protein